MKKILLLSCLLIAGFSSYAQVQTPAASPTSKLEQKVGLTDVTVVYSRPSMRGRAIYGDLVPFGELWRTGANANTIVTFSDDVTIGGNTVAKGSYALFSRPGAEEWELMLYGATDNWGAPQNFDASKVVASVKVPVMKLPFMVETFTIDVDEITNTGAKLGVIWADQYVAMPFEVPTDAKVMASIEKTMAGNSATSDDYFSAAVYYLENGKDLDKAQEWVDKSIAMRKDGAPYWMLRQKSLIHAARGDKAGAVAAAKLSLAGAEKAGNQDYVRMNKKSLMEWGGM